MPRTTSPTFGAGHAGQQRAHVREGGSSGADLVFLDLEDACAPAVKESARAVAVGALTGQDWGTHGAGGAHQRHRHAVVPRRHH